MLGVGTPDVLAIRASRVTWIETKVAARMPSRDTTRLLGDDGLSIAQRNWHLDWHKHGGDSLILIGVRGTGAHWAVAGRHADAVNEMSVGQLNDLALVRGAKHGDGFWIGFRSIL